MKAFYCSVFICIVLIMACAKEQIKNVNPNATREARQLLNFIYDIQGKCILAGQRNYIFSGSTQTERAKTFTGKYPIIWGSDFSFCYRGEKPQNFQHRGPLNLTMPGDSLYDTGLTPAEARDRLIANVIQRHRKVFEATAEGRRAGVVAPVS